MAEREISFSDSEREQIAFYGHEAARLGEQFVDSLNSGKLDLMLLQFALVKSGSNESFLLGESLTHEIDIVKEIVRRARVILQFEGRDDISELDRHTQKLGLGSLFDPDSKISQRLRFCGL